MAAPAADPPLNFSTFVISLASSALAHLGHAEQPSHHPSQVDLKLARHSIELLDMLAEKSKGNLDPDEQQLLDAVRGEIHAKFAAATRG